MINSSRWVHPRFLVLNSLSSTSSRIYRINEIVCLSSEVFWQVSVIEWGTVIDLFHPSGRIPLDKDVGISDTTLSESGGYVAHIIHAIILDEVYFFESHTTLAILSHSIEYIDFFDCYTRPDNFLMLTDSMDRSLCSDTAVVNCTGSHNWPSSDQISLPL